MTNEISKLPLKILNELDCLGAIDKSDFQVFFNEVQTRDTLADFKKHANSYKNCEVIEDCGVVLTIINEFQKFKGQPRGTLAYIDFKNEHQNIVLHIA